MNSFGERLKSLRKLRKLTQRELGLKLNVTESLISKYEKNVAQPSYEVLLKMAEILNVSTTYLTGETNSISDTPIINDEITEIARRLENIPLEKQKKILKAINAMLDI